LEVCARSVFVGATTRYIYYFTGIKPTYVPAYCGYVNADYKPSGNTVSAQFIW
jgi:hypothetical protein